MYDHLKKKKKTRRHLSIIYMQIYIYIYIYLNYENKMLSNYITVYVVIVRKIWRYQRVFRNLISKMDRQYNYQRIKRTNKNEKPLFKGNILYIG